MGLDIDQKKLVAAVVLGTLAFCALFLAKGVTSIVATVSLPLQPAGSIPPGGKGKSSLASPGSQPPDIKEILKRNIFDSTTGPLWPPPEQDMGLELPEEQEMDENFELDPNAPPPLCEGSLRLVASIYSDRLPEWSFAAISSGSGIPLLYRQGGQVEQNQVLAIYPSAVFIKPNAGKPCSLALFTQQPGADKKTRPTREVAASKAATRAATRTTGTAGLSKKELEEGIQKVSDNEFSISRDLVDKVLQNQAALMRSARIVPHERNGEVVGVKLYGIRRNSLLGKLGLQNGDLLRTINGYDMTSPDRALEAYSRLRSADTLTVALQRRGKNTNVNYRIR